MRKVYVILYSGNNSSEIESAIKSYDSWFHFDKNSYFISVPSNMTAEQIRLKLESNISIGVDKLLILDVTIKEYNGYLHENEWEWIKTEKGRT